MLYIRKSVITLSLNFLLFLVFVFIKCLLLLLFVHFVLLLLLFCTYCPFTFTFLYLLVFYLLFLSYITFCDNNYFFFNSITVTCLGYKLHVILLVQCVPLFCMPNHYVFTCGDN